jgi:hypothetical protein
VGLIPENELAETLGVPIHNATRGPVCDQRYMTQVPGIFSCGNALQVNDLVDYVSESGEAAGRAAAHWATAPWATAPWAAGDPGQGGAGGGDTGSHADFTADENFLCMTPQRLDLRALEDETVLFFRSREERGKTRVRIRLGERELLSKSYNQLRPPEMERLTLRLGKAGIRGGDKIRLTMNDEEH